MINRNTLMPGAISAESFNKFLAELYKRTDKRGVFYSGTPEKFNPAIAYLLVDAICLWEAEKWRFLTISDNARLNPEAHVFPNSIPASISFNLVKL